MSVAKSTFLVVVSFLDPRDEIFFFGIWSFFKLNFSIAYFLRIGNFIFQVALNIFHKVFTLFLNKMSIHSKYKLPQFFLSNYIFLCISFFIYYFTGTFVFCSCSKHYNVRTYLQVCMAPIHKHPLDKWADSLSHKA